MLNRNLLRSSMAKIDITQKELAEQIGISSATMSGRMRGKSCFDSDEIDRICAVLGITDNTEKVNIFLGTVSHKWDRTSPKKHVEGTAVRHIP